MRYLWYYKPDSMVAKITYAFRLLAILLIMPVVILILLVSKTVSNSPIPHGKYSFIERIYLRIS